MKPRTAPTSALTCPEQDLEQDAGQDAEVQAQIVVLHARELRAQIPANDLSRFGEDLWRLDHALLQRHAVGMVLDFTAIPTRYRATIKDLCYAMLSGPLPPGETRPSVATVAQVFSVLKRFLRWLDTYTPRPGQVPGPALAELSARDLEAYQLHLLATSRSGGTRASIRGGVRMLWRYRQVLPDDHLRLDPRLVAGWGESARPLPPENATDRIPEPVLGPLIVWCLRFIDDFAPDVFAVHAHRAWLRSDRTSNHPGHYTGATAGLRDLLDEHLATARPLPGHRGKPNMGFLALILGCNPKTLIRLRPWVDEAAGVVGVSDYSYFDVALSGRLDGQPWLEAISSHLNHAYGLATLMRMMQAAAHILLAFLSGMRDSEIKHLRRGCLHTERDATGNPYRWTVTSLAFKGEDDPAGVEATWVIGAPAARAISILERLQPPDTPWLFAVLPSPGMGPARRGGNDVLSTSASNHQLNELATWISDYCTTHDRTDTIPPIAGRAWPLTTSQFRRTLAWFIARRPGGAIAGAIAYRHLSVQMFEGYAGLSDSGFRAEVEAEQALARGEQLLAMTDAHEHSHLGGPSAAEAARRLSDFAQHAHFAGNVSTDAQRLKRLMARQDPAIYPGTYVTCVHDHTKALCRQRRDTSGAPRPELGACLPLHCANVALTGDNIAAWEAEIRRLDERLTARPPLPPLLAHQLQARRDEVAAFLNRHQEHAP